MLFGFIIAKIPRSKNYVIYVPEKRHLYYGSTPNFIVEEPLLLREDILALIDLALDLKDEIWFRELMQGR